MLFVSTRFPIILSLSGALHLAAFSIQLPSRAVGPVVASPAVLQVRITQPSISRPAEAAAPAIAAPATRVVAAPHAAPAAKSGASSLTMKRELRDARPSPRAFSSLAYAAPDANSDSTPTPPTAGSVPADGPPQVAINVPETEAASGGEGHDIVVSDTPPDTPSASKIAIAAPGLAFSTPPRYPEEARWEKRTGKTQLKFRLRPDGSPTAVRLLVSSGHEDLDAAAIEALHGWRFKVSQEVDPSTWFKYAIRFELL